MIELHFPFIESAILVAFLGAAFVRRFTDAHRARFWATLFTAAVFALSIAAWQDYGLLQASLPSGQHALEADDRWHLMQRLIGREVFTIDQLSAPLLPLAALLYFATTVATLRTKVRRFSFAWMLFSEGVLLATFSCRIPGVIVALMIVGAVPPFIELRGRGANGRAFALHMGLFTALCVCGWLGLQMTPAGTAVGPTTAVLLLAAMLIRGGVFPFHTWMVDLFDRASFGTALLFTAPMTGAYGAVRLVLPHASSDLLRSLGIVSLITAVYAAAMALVQREARRFFCYVLLSHSALVFVGLEMVRPVGLTGALCVWLSVGMSLSAFGLTIRALEARRGRIKLGVHQGLYEHTPSLALCFVLTGLASVGFPGTIGFIGGELLVDGAVETYPSIGLAVVLAAALNGIALVRSYFLIFTGTRYQSNIALGIVPRERASMLALSALILLGGLIPQYGVISRYYAAEEILSVRGVNIGEPLDSPSHNHDPEHADAHNFDEDELEAWWHREILTE
ncbi:MAG: proton-conducting transporter membrane subunit [Pirellulales bacterium]